MGAVYKWLLVVKDLYTKYTWVAPLKNKSASKVSFSLFKIIMELPKFPIQIQTDNGREFYNKLFNNLMDSLNIKITHGRPLKPSSQGAVERVNATLKNNLL